VPWALPDGIRELAPAEKPVCAALAHFSHPLLGVLHRLAAANCAAHASGPAALAARPMLSARARCTLGAAVLCCTEQLMLITMSSEFCAMPQLGVVALYWQRHRCCRHCRQSPPPPRSPLLTSLPRRQHWQRVQLQHLATWCGAWSAQHDISPISTMPHRWSGVCWQTVEGAPWRATAAGASAESLLPHPTACRAAAHSRGGQHAAAAQWRWQWRWRRQ
jgi:hypothetical protein